MSQKIKTATQYHSECSPLISRDIRQRCPHNRQSFLLKNYVTIRRQQDIKMHANNHETFLNIFLLSLQYRSSKKVWWSALQKRSRTSLSNRLVAHPLLMKERCFIAYGHTKGKALLLVRSAKLSPFGPG